MKAPKNIFFVLLLLSSSIALFMGIGFSIDLYHYLTLSSSSPVQIDSWEIKESKPGKFAIFANYRFSFQGRSYKDKFLFKKPIYPNPDAAKQQIAFWKEQPWQIWYREKSPDVATLQKCFPFKKGIHFVLCLFIVFYFLGLRIYIHRLLLNKL